MWRNNHLALREVPRLRPPLQVPEMRLLRTIEGDYLAKVMVSLKIFPSDIVADMSGLKQTITKSLEGKATIYKFDEEPVAFGLVALIVHILMPEDASGIMDEIEGRLKSIDGISEVEVLVSRR